MCVYIVVVVVIIRIFSYRLYNDDQKFKHVVFNMNIIIIIIIIINGNNSIYMYPNGEREREKEKKTNSGSIELIKSYMTLGHQIINRIIVVEC